MQQFLTPLPSNRGFWGESGRDTYAGIAPSNANVAFDQKKNVKSIKFPAEFLKMGFLFSHTLWVRLVLLFRFNMRVLRAPPSSPLPAYLPVSLLCSST